MTDSEIVGTEGAEQQDGILNQRQLYIRNTSISGYRNSVNNADKGRDKGDIVAAARIAEDTSHSNVASLFLDQTGTLPPNRTFEYVRETPNVEWGDLKSEWANLIGFGGDPTGENDSSTALQAAIDSGAKTIYLPGGTRFFFDNEVKIRGSVCRIIGLEGRCKFGEQAVWRLIDKDSERPDATAVVIERCNNVSGGRSVPIIHESNLAKRHLKNGSLVLFDVSSSFYEGEKSSLRRHDRDKEKIALRVGRTYFCACWRTMSSGICAKNFAKFCSKTKIARPLRSNGRR